MSNASSLSADESRRLRRVKIGVVILLGVFVWQIFSRAPEYWPLTRWAMYAGSSALITRLGGEQLQVSDSTGATHVLNPADLGFLGRNIMMDAFNTSDPEKSVTYRNLLIDRVRTALPNIEPVELEGWLLVWDVHPYAFPPINREQPRERTSLGSFPAAFYTEPTTSPDSDPDVLFGESLGLLAFRLTGPNQVNPCGQLYARTWWNVRAAPAADYHITLVLADSTGVGRVQSDSPLAYALTSRWEAGQEWLDRRIMDIPCDAPVGTYNLLVGLYELETVQNLDVTYPDGTPYGKLAYLTTVEIVEGGQQ